MIKCRLSSNAVNFDKLKAAFYSGSFDTQDVKVNCSRHTIEFETLSDYPVREKYLELSKELQGIPTAVVYADERLGLHVGAILSNSGRVDYDIRYKDYSKDAYEIAFDMIGGQYRYHYDEQKKTYVLN